MQKFPIEEVRALCEKLAQELSVELIDVEYKVSKNPSLTVFIDTEDGVDLDTLEKYHRALEAPLDAMDPTSGATYTLNVSSPGLDRPLKTAKDFERRLGELVEIKLYAPMRGKKVFEGELSGFDDNTVTVIIDGEEKKFSRSAIAKISVAIVF